MYRARIPVLLVCALILGTSFVHAEETVYTEETLAITTIDCSSLPGTVPITQESRAAARQAGIKDNIDCWNPKDANVGLAAGEAKVYLSTKLCPNDRDNYGGAGAEGTITGLSSKFAVCAAAFIKTASTQMKVCVREGYRTDEKQQEYYDRYKKGTGGLACDPSKKKCEHPSGQAIDVNVERESDYARLWTTAPQYGLSFYLRERDKYHFVSAKLGCGGVGSGSAGESVTTSLPITSYDFPEYAPTVNPFQNPNLQFLMPLMQQQFQAQQPAPQMPQTPYIPPAQTIPSVNQTPSSIPSTPSSPTPVTPATPSTSNTQTNPTPQNPTTLATNPLTVPTATVPTSTPTRPTTQDEARPAWIDIILGYAQFEPTALSGETASELHTDLGEVSQLNAGEVHGTVAQPVFSNASSQQPYAVQTFTSSDLRDSPGTTLVQNAERARTLGMLAQLRAGLEQFLGINNPPRTVQNAARWYP